MTSALVVQALRLRVRMILVVSAALFATALMEASLFPALKGTIGDIGDNLPKGVAELIGGGDFGTIVGWLKVEVFSIVAPFGFAGVGMVVAVGGTAGDEEAGSLDLVLAHPVRRREIVLANALAAVAAVLVSALSLWLGLVLGVYAVAGGGVSAGLLAAAVLHAALLGLVFMALGLAVGAATGRRAVALGIATGAALLAYLVDGFASAAGSVSWLRRLTPFFYDTGGDPLVNGVAAWHLVVLASLVGVLVAVATVALERRDLRG